MQARDLSFLTKMKGVEYVLFADTEGMFVIRKQIRESPESVVPAATYYVIQGTIFQAPDIHAVINSRLVSCLYYLKRAFNQINSFVCFDPDQAYSYDTEAVYGRVSAPTKQDRTAEELNKLQINAKRSENILKSVFAKFSPENAQQDGTKRRRPPGKEPAASANKKRRVGE